MKGEVGVPAALAKGEAAKEVSGVPFLTRGDAALFFAACDMLAVRALRAVFAGSITVSYGGGCLYRDE